MIAVSGGPDSTVLLDILYRLKEEFDYELLICHVNHGLRGAESDEDERFVVSLSERYDLPLTVRRFDRDEVERVRLGNVEKECRILRYEKLVHTAEELNCSMIATGHTMSDQAETVLHRILRGTGITGLAGVQMVREDLGIPIIRPLLVMTRQDVLEYARDAGFSFRSDSMNDDERFTRVKIRNVMIPLLKEQFNPKVEKTLADLAFLANDEERFWQKYLGDLRTRIGDASFASPGNRRAFLELTSAEQRRMMYTFCSQNRIDPGLHRIEDARNLLLGTRPQAEIHLSGDVRLVRRYDEFYITAKQDEIPVVQEYELEVPGTVVLDSFGVEIQTTVQPVNVKTLGALHAFLAEFDWDKVATPIRVRSRLNGDTIYPLGMKGRKKLKKILQEKRIPLEQRDRIPVVCFRDEIGWIVGCCVSERFRIDDRTRIVLRMEVRRVEKE